MKKNIFYLSILIILISFLFAIPVIDKISVSRTYSYISSYDEAGFERVGVIIENNNSLQSVDNYTYYSFLDDCAIKNNLVIYILTSGFSKETNDMQNNIYLSTNDLFLKDRLLLYSGYADNLNENNSYTTYNNGNSRLLSFNYPYQTSVSTIHHYNEKGKYINLISVSGDLETNVRNFLQDVANEYGEIIVESPYTSSKSTLIEDDSEAAANLFEKIDIKLSIALILILLLCSKIFSYGRKISLYKIDGTKSIAIYLKIFLIPFIQYMMLASSLFCVIIFLLFNSNWMSLYTILIITFLQIAQFFVLTLFVSIINYFIIVFTPITKSIKGENKLSEVQTIAYFAKTFAIFMIIPLLSTTLMNTKDLFVMWNRYDKVLASLEGYYTFGVQGASSKYSSDIGNDNYIALRDFLANDGNLFESFKAFFIDDIAQFDPRIKDEYYAVDKFYLQKNDLISQCDLEEICVFIYDKSTYDLTNIDKKIRNMLREEVPINIISYSNKLRTFETKDLFYSDYMSDLPLIYLPEEKNLEGQLNNSILYFDGNLEDVQEYVDSKFIEFGYSPMFNMSPMKIMFERQFKLYENLNIKGFYDFLILLVAYILTNRLLIDMDIDNNRKRYIIARCEGLNPYSFVTYFIKIVSPTCIAFTLNVIMRRLPLNSNIVLVLIMLTLIEIALYGMFKYKLNNVRRFK